MPLTLVDAAEPRATRVLRGVTDRVMGGVSQASLVLEDVDGERAWHLVGDVSLENDGGFVQMATDLDGPARDWSPFTHLILRVRGNGERYEVRVRTDDVVRPWQSYRFAFEAKPAWHAIEIPLTDLEPYRIDTPFDATRVRRMGLLGVGRAFHADLALSRAWLVSRG